MWDGSEYKKDILNGSVFMDFKSWNKIFFTSDFDSITRNKYYKCLI